MVRDVNSIQLSGSVGEQTGTLGAATGRGVETLLAGKAPSVQRRENFQTAYIKVRCGKLALRGSRFGSKANAHACES